MAIYNGPKRTISTNDGFGLLCELDLFELFIQFLIKVNDYYVERLLVYF